MPHLDIRSFGQARMTLSGQDVAWPAASARDLLFYLLSCSAGRSRADIVTALWPDEELSRAAAGNRFRVALHRLRAALNDAGAVVEDLERYRLSGRVLEASDAHALDQFLRAADQAHDPATKRQALLQATALYVGEYLPDQPSEWACAVRAEHLAAYVRASLELSMLHCGAAECRAAIRTLALALKADPLIGENYHQDLMACLGSVEGKYAAVEHYRRFLKLLRDDLSDAPMLETTELAGRFKAGDDVCPHQIGRDVPCGRHLARRAPALDVPGIPLESSDDQLHAELQRVRTVLQLSNTLQGATSPAELAQRARQTLADALQLDGLWLLTTAGTVLGGPELPPEVQAACETGLGAGLEDLEGPGTSGPIGLQPLLGASGDLLAVTRSVVA